MDCIGERTRFWVGIALLAEEEESKGIIAMGANGDMRRGKEIEEGRRISGVM